MVKVDGYLLIGILGTILAVVFAAREFLGWWNDLGEFGFWASIVMAMGGYVLTASRRQSKAILRGLAGLRGTLEQGFAETQAGVGRVEQGLGRVDANTAETVVLLREIRDRL